MKMDDSVMTDGRADIAKLRPVIGLLDVGGYYGVGELIGKCFSAGRPTPEAE